ncbi:class I SAM-dependent methyltransferase [Virgisporangium aliadipatigenens]|uniref:class I SAM-dependent methyltransferase n=1 Tax=Virgisporangium aliadipatigenens TaxID=741659 RepID=UPI001944BF3A|nr:class I SAM-dependent methyltransferase [Virgisporangium aliadipatigenens]
MDSRDDRPVELVIDGGAREWARLDAAHRSGDLDDAGWFAAAQAVLVPAYLAGDNPRAQSGHSGDEARWEEARRHILAAVDRPGDLLDVGCASGHLMESLHRWSSGAVEPYGLELSPELADLARRRLPAWAPRIWIGNALYWIPPAGRRFDYVRTGLDYVPAVRRADLIAHLLRHVVARRLVVGSFNEENAERTTERDVTAMGYRIAGRDERPHPDPRVTRRVFWIDV